jgi:hypothetical protein
MGMYSPLESIEGYPGPPSMATMGSVGGAVVSEWGKISNRALIIVWSDGWVQYSVTSMVPHSSVFDSRQALSTSVSAAARVRAAPGPGPRLLVAPRALAGTDPVVTVEAINTTDVRMR